jgi:hypothetical protein
VQFSNGWFYRKNGNTRPKLPAVNADCGSFSTGLLKNLDGKGNFIGTGYGYSMGEDLRRNIERNQDIHKDRSKCFSLFTE